MDAMDLIEGVAENRRLARAARINKARLLERDRLIAEQSMKHVTSSQRKFEEHKCHEMPMKYRIRRYAARSNPYDRDVLPCYVWTICRVDGVDGWMDNYDSCGTLTGVAHEPNFCPWCGEPLKKLPDNLRGYEGTLEVDYGYDDDYGEMPDGISSKPYVVKR